MEDLKLLLAFGRDNVPAVLCLYLTWWGTNRLAAVLDRLSEALLNLKDKVDQCPKRQ